MRKPSRKGHAGEVGERFFLRRKDVQVRVGLQLPLFVLRCCLIRTGCGPIVNVTEMFEDVISFGRIVSIARAEWTRQEGGHSLCNVLAPAIQDQSTASSSAQFVNAGPERRVQVIPSRRNGKRTPTGPILHWCFGSLAIRTTEAKALHMNSASASGRIPA